MKSKMPITGKELVDRLVEVGARRFYTLEDIPVHMDTKGNYKFGPPRYIHESAGQPIIVQVSFNAGRTRAEMIWDDGEYYECVIHEIKTIDVGPVNKMLKRMLLQIEQGIWEKADS